MNRSPRTGVRLEALSSAQYARISQLLDEALELAPKTRMAWLNALEAREPELAADVRELLDPKEDRVASILAGEGYVAEQLAALPGTDESLIGRQFGPYCVRSLLGRGGMGTVWLAERVDGLFTRRVALKLVHPALIGTGVTERLARERAILASLDHPNIARLYDAGIADDGQPYLALEYVAGTPFSAYCDERRLAVRARLELFKQMLAAVHYAHAHLVIHRDLKPSNILVTEEGRVCLLDFGIAKLFSERAAKETELTRLSGGALSLDYAAPEQVAGAPITIAADIYALGVILYESLSGEQPYRLARRSRGALEEAILWADPAPLSGIAPSAEAATARATTSARLARLLRGDLDTVVLKALRKSPTERYATVDALAEDITRWLRGEPVLARRASLVARTAKFVRRHWLGSVIAAAFVSVLIMGLAVSTHEATLAERARDAALQAQFRSLTQTAAARLAAGDPAAAIAIVLEALRQPGARHADTSEVLGLFQEARAADSQVLAFSPRGDIWGMLPEANDVRVLTVASDRVPRILDATTDRELAALHGRVEPLTEYNFAVFSPDGQRILTTSSDGDARLWRMAAGEPLALRGHTDRIWSADFAPDGQRVVTTSGDKTTRIWNTVTGKELLRLRHGDRVFDVRFSADGRRIITASHDTTARVWDAATGRELLKLSGHQEEVAGAAFSPDGSRIVTASSDMTARIWDAVGGRLIAPLTGHGDVLTDASFSRDGQRVVTTSVDRTARIWDAVYGRPLAVLFHPAEVWNAAFSPDDRYVATVAKDQTLRVWEVSLKWQSMLRLQHGRQVSGATFAPDGRRILSASYDGTAVIWDATTGRAVMTLRGHADRVWCAAFSPDGRQVVTGSRDRTVRVWDAATGRELLRLTGFPAGIQSASFSSDARRILTAPQERVASIWDAATGRELVRLKGHTESVVAAAFSADSARVATASLDKTARIWDAVTGRELLRVGHADAIASAAFSPDGRRLLTASDDRTARVWDVATGRELLRLRGHRDVLSDAEFSPDGGRIVTASRDRTIRVWDAATGRVIMLYKGHDDDVRRAGFSPDGTRIISASDDQTARVWDARIASLADQLAWAEAAQFDPLPQSARFALGLPAADDQEYVGSGGESAHRRAPESREPATLAQSGARADAAARVARTAEERNVQLLDSFRYFAAAVARAQALGWLESDFRAWRYRRATLARQLAHAGMMGQVASIYETVRAQSTPQRPTLWGRFPKLSER